MNTTPRNTPRFLPTLTEVVRPSEITRERVPQAMDADALAQAVLHRVNPLIESRLREEINALVNLLVAEQIHALKAQILQELAVVVRQAVHEVVATSFDSH